MDSRNAEINAAVRQFGWKKITALAFYGDKNDLERYLQEECKTVAGKIKIAKDTQVETKQTLVGTNFTAYQLANHKNSQLTGWFTRQFVTWPTANINSYMDLLVKYTGLFALHEYIAAKIQLKGMDNKDCVQRIDIFSQIILSLKDDKPAATLTNMLIRANIPKGFFSTEFFDLLKSLKSLSDGQLKQCLQEYQGHMESIPKESLTAFDSRMCQALLSPKEPELRTEAPAPK